MDLFIIPWFFSTASSNYCHNHYHPHLIMPSFPLNCTTKSSHQSSIHVLEQFKVDLEVPDIRALFESDIEAMNEKAYSA